MIHAIRRNHTGHQVLNNTVVAARRYGRNFRKVARATFSQRPVIDKLKELKSLLEYLHPNHDGTHVQQIA